MYKDGARTDNKRDKEGSVLIRVTLGALQSEHYTRIIRNTSHT